MPDNKPHIYAFDFDGTLIKGDSYRAFLLHAAGPVRVAAGIARCAPRLLWGWLNRSSKPRPKELLFRTVFKDMQRQKFDNACLTFASQLALRENALVCRRMREAVDRGHTVYIISASVAEWIRPWAALKGIPAEQVIATELLPDKTGRLNGSFNGGFCSGSAKAKRFLAAEPDRNSYHLTVYSDGPGDSQLLALADRRFII